MSLVTGDRIFYSWYHRVPSVMRRTNSAPPPDPNGYGEGKILGKPLRRILEIQSKGEYLLKKMSKLEKFLQALTKKHFKDILRIRIHYGRRNGEEDIFDDIKLGDSVNYARSKTDGRPFWEVADSKNWEGIFTISAGAIRCLTY